MDEGKLRKRILIETVLFLVVVTAAIAVLSYIIGSYQGPFDTPESYALLASPFVLLGVLLVAVHHQLQRNRKRRRLTIEINPSD